MIERAREEPIKVAAAPEESSLDPTGVGDAFRAGFVAGQAWGLDLERSAQVGSLLATHSLEHVGPQEYELDPARFVARFAAAFGDAAAAEIGGFLS